MAPFHGKTFSRRGGSRGGHVGGDKRLNFAAHTSSYRLLELERGTASLPNAVDPNSTDQAETTGNESILRPDRPAFFFGTDGLYLPAQIGLTPGRKVHLVLDPTSSEAMSKLPSLIQENWKNMTESEHLTTVQKMVIEKITQKSIDTFREKGAQQPLWDKTLHLQTKLEKHPKKFHKKYEVLTLKRWNMNIRMHAEPGMGKSRAVALLVVTHVMTREGGSSNFKNKKDGHAAPYALIFEPTHETAIDMFKTIQNLCKGTAIIARAAYGGGHETRQPQYDLISGGCDILIVTSGRLSDFLRNGRISLKTTELVVVDEADTMIGSSQWQKHLGILEKELGEFQDRPLGFVFASTSYSPSAIETIGNLFNKTAMPRAHIAYHIESDQPARFVDVKQEFFLTSPSKQEQVNDLVARITGCDKGTKHIVMVIERGTVDALLLALQAAGCEHVAAYHGGKYQGGPNGRQQNFSAYNNLEADYLIGTFKVLGYGVNLANAGRLWLLGFPLPAGDQSPLDVLASALGRVGRLGNVETIATTLHTGSAPRGLFKFLEENEQAIPNDLVEKDPEEKLNGVENTAGKVNDGTEEAAQTTS